MRILHKAIIAAIAITIAIISAATTFGLRFAMLVGLPLLIGGLVFITWRVVVARERRSWAEKVKAARRHEDLE
ncbi:MAG: hypothetical protein JO357_05480 [Hyphomicrobiales bacterium]|nr:hypothetical protein [Hyphomicrobiales bacterium]MBV9754329.1 hypothetical protein [Hyphomicrobiales bacterium]